MTAFTRKLSVCAAEAGFASVDEYIAEVVNDDLTGGDGEETPNLDHLFTPERLAEIESARAEIKAGNSFTADQVREHFKKKREEWLRTHAG